MSPGYTIQLQVQTYHFFLIVLPLISKSLQSFLYPSFYCLYTNLRYG